MRKRKIDNKMSSVQSFLERMEPLQDSKLKKWRAGLVVLFSLGFLTAMIWISYEQYLEKIYATGPILKNVVSLEYRQPDGQDNKLVADPLLIFLSDRSVEKSPVLDLGNWDSFFATKGGVPVRIFQTADRQMSKSGDIITYNIYVLNTSSQAIRDIVLYDLLPMGTEFVRVKEGGPDKFDKQANLLEWNIDELPGMDQQGDLQPVIKTFQVRVK